MSSSNNKSAHYDSIYYDTDDEDNATDHKIPTNDELLYDPSMDDQDEAWILNQIKKAGGKEAQTDAVLTCPMCFSPLSYNCQRHERYTNQYRAMFVTNCRIIKSERYKDKGSDEAFYPVHCSSCDTHVAMMDEEEVYHFFNIIAT
ncbi:hypothetical protein O0I10_001926 [Lichtheimia ornata]|uniref:E2F-associated phosphoprotein n=1 Tax=Lichtheimia ornata TaxID=688661 RepID=A0AAD7VBN6_9FUNG|nr:uncharacterized protein O0I10_001926 [Lichtheimia ornata]KAJ8662233.1 hypothetical protein O0I10_001926 [Lichtheimia ornata]